MAKQSNPKPAPKYRDADTGHYVTPEYAKENPKTTVKETDKTKPSPKKKP